MATVSLRFRMLDGTCHTLQVLPEVPLVSLKERFVDGCADFSEIKFIVGTLEVGRNLCVLCGEIELSPDSEITVVKSLSPTPAKAVQVDDKRDVRAPKNSCETAIAQECATSNTILKFSSESSIRGLNKFRIAFEFCRQRLEACPGHKVCIVAPLVPLIKSYFEAAQLQHFAPGQRLFHFRLILGTSDVDAWGRAQWRTAVETTDIVLTSPQLFLDAVMAGHVALTMFCAVAFDECQHCIGSHPFSKLAQHILASGEDIRMLGICSRLHRRRYMDGGGAALMKALHAVLFCL